MGKISIGICLSDKEYEKRFCAILFKYYRQQIEVHMFSDTDELLQCVDEGRLHAVLVEDSFDFATIRDGAKCVCLCEDLQTVEKTREEVIYLNKYQEVSCIIDDVLQGIGAEVSEMMSNPSGPSKCKIVGMYGLSESDMQLPFALTLASIMSESEKILVLDLQENSGFSQFRDREMQIGLEDLLLMAKRGRCRTDKITSAIGHLEKVDYIYPAENSEVLCEATAALYLELIKMLKQELDYSVILINFGARFQGFFEVVNECKFLYLTERRGGLGRWREFEFLAEMERHGYEEIKNKIVRVDLPILSAQMSDVGRIIEQWKWNEFGDYIRKMTLRGAKVGGSFT